MFERATTIDEAIDEAAVWAASLPGDFIIDVTDHPRDTVIRVTGRLIPSELDVSLTLHLDDRAAAAQYRVDVRDDDALVWLHDRHLGHETEPAMRGPEHLHVPSGATEKRRPADPQTLESVRVALVRTNQEWA